MRDKKDLIQDYVESLLPARSLSLSQIGDRLVADQKWGINIGAVEGAFLQFLIRAFRIERILEVGAQYGYSTQWMLDALPSSGHITTLESGEQHYKQATQLIADPRVRFVLGDALTTMPQQLSQGPFDLVFIDANKKAYPEYLKFAKALLKTGGLVLADNTFLFGTVLHSEVPENVSRGLWQAMRDFNQNLFHDQDFITCIIPTAEGLTLAMKK